MWEFCYFGLLELQPARTLFYKDVTNNFNSPTLLLLSYFMHRRTTQQDLAFLLNNCYHNTQVKNKLSFVVPLLEYLTEFLQQY